jgi:UDP-GlcNAc:undecaprenyl-phosphate GlcNAc-1-phosphate transferase
MRLLVAVGLGAAASAVGWTVARGIFAAPLFARRNHRGAMVPVGAGVLLVVAIVAADAVLVVVDRFADRHPGDIGATALVIAAVAGFCVLGLLDDLAAVGDDRGFTGHLRALAQGRLTTGGLKLVGGGLLAVVVSGMVHQGGVGALFVDALLVALGANVGNLFDRAPGRTIKVGAFAMVAVVLLASSADRAQLTGVALMLGAALGLLGFDLGEQLMLGDAGSNAIGATAALGVVLTCGLPVRIGVLVVLLALNVASERVSFSRVIDAVGPLRFLDRLGRNQR